MSPTSSTWACYDEQRQPDDAQGVVVGVGARSLTTSSGGKFTFWPSDSGHSQQDQGAMSLRAKGSSMAKTSASPDRADNLAQLFLQRVEKSGDNEAFRIPDNGDWTSVTWNQAAERVEALAAGLLALGVEPEDRGGIAHGHPLEVDLAR